MGEVRLCMKMTELVGMGQRESTAARERTASGTSFPLGGNQSQVGKKKNYNICIYFSFSTTVYIQCLFALVSDV